MSAITSIIATNQFSSISTTEVKLPQEKAAAPSDYAEALLASPSMADTFAEPKLDQQFIAHTYTLGEQFSTEGQLKSTHESKRMSNRDQ